MKRPFKPTVNYRASLGIVNLDFTKDQLAGIGHVAMAYNEVEERLFNLFGMATQLAGWMLVEVFTRINGIEGVAAIISAGAENAGLSPEELTLLAETLGNNGFKKYKTCRDAVIHARSVNAPAGVGIRMERRATFQEVLLTATALETLAAHLRMLGHEVSHFDDIFHDRRQFKALQPEGRDKEEYEEAFRDWRARFDDSRRQRLALAPLPDFPPDAVLVSAQGEWAERLPFRRREKPKE